jgi:peptidoglycan hydrolase-like protein with peptidoglycan-binding domain
VSAKKAVTALPVGSLYRNLAQGAKGDDIKVLQEFLNKAGFYPEGFISGFFGALTKQAVIRFQEKYASEILTPVGLTKGSGFVGSGTRKKIIELLGK